MLSLINDILDLSKIETGKMSIHCEEFQPGEILQQVCDTLAPLLRDNGNVLQVPDFCGLPQMYSDATKFRQVFTNLLSNACKFTHNGRITVTAATLPQRSDWLQVAVQDTGIGMDEAQQARVFEAFVQAEASTSANYGGTGLGLAICQDYCKLMGGNIRVHSVIAEGSTFTVQLPVRMRAPSAPESTHAAA